MSIKKISDVVNSFYINLESRTDRKEHVEKELAKIGITPNRFNAIKMENGAIGCSMSHLKCLQLAKKNNWDHVLICEDDIEFLNPTLFINQTIQFFKTYDDWDVMLLAGNSIPPFKKVESFCVKISKCQTTTGYLVNGHYFDTIIDNIKKGLENLIKNPEQHTEYAIDKYWFLLQEKDNWYLPVPLTVSQRYSYSDIEKKMTNYKQLMLDLDKSKITEKYKNYILERKGARINKVDGMNNIDMVFYINLDSRKDRLQHIQKELAKTNIDPIKLNRFPAIYVKENPSLGCSLSHLNALEMFMNSPSIYQTCLILEDDFEFILDQNTINTMMNKAFTLTPFFDIIMLSGNINKQQYITQIDDNFLTKIVDSQTTSGYLINRCFVNKLIENIKEGARLLRIHNHPPKFAIDQYWKHLQPSSEWYSFNPKIGKQMESYSDIEGKIMNYNC